MWNSHDSGRYLLVIPCPVVSVNGQIQQFKKRVVTKDTGSHHEVSY